MKAKHQKGGTWVIILFSFAGLALLTAAIIAGMNFNNGDVFPEEYYLDNPSLSPTPVPCQNTSDPREIDWQGYMSKGNKVSVVFDCSRFYFDDSKFTGDWQTDPMGDIKGGETYVIQYAENDGWYATGLVQSRGGVETIKYPSGIAPVENYQFSVWGRTYDFNRQGEVYDRDYGIVGHLQIPSWELLDANRQKKALPHWIRVEDDKFEGKTCSDFCGYLNKQCSTNRCPAGPAPCDCNGGLCEAERQGSSGWGSMTCELSEDGNCDAPIRTPLYERPSLNNLFCCCG